MTAVTKESEKEWHDELYRKRVREGLVVPPDIMKRYFELRNPHLFDLERMFELAGDVCGKRILCLGRGDENSTVLLALKGAQVYAVDLSYEAVRLQQKMALANAVQERLHAVASAAEELPFPDHSFDIVFGYAILHHVPDKLSAVTREVARILRHEGFALFSEPVTRSRLLRWLRSLFPARRDLSPLERQLTDGDLQNFATYFEMEFFPFHVIARLDRFFLSQPLRHLPRWKRSIVYFFHGMDDLLLRAKSFHRFAGNLVVKLERRPGVWAKNTSLGGGPCVASQES